MKGSVVLYTFGANTASLIWHIIIWMKIYRNVDEDHVESSVHYLLNYTWIFLVVKNENYVLLYSVKTVFFNSDDKNISETRLLTYVFYMHCSFICLYGPIRKMCSFQNYSCSFFIFLFILS